MKKSLIAMAIGTFVLGIAEFIIMGISTDIAEDLNVSIPKVGSLISIYAIGVCIGAPILLIFRKMPLNRILIMLATIMAVGHLMSALSVNFAMLFIARLIAGLPHGAFFAVGSIVAGRIAEKGKETQAVSIMVAGMTVANVIGVPLGTALSIWFSWRYTFLLASLVSILTLYFLYRWVPLVEAEEDHGWRSQFRLFGARSAWLIIITTFCANAGIFCMTSYIRPILMEQAGFSEAAITPLMMLAGVGMVAGNLISGRLSDRTSPGIVVTLSALFTLFALVVAHFCSSIALIMVISMVICYAGQFAVSSPEQLLIIKYSQGAALMGGAAIQIAFNFGNAVGAYLGGIPIDMGLGYTWSPVIGAILMLIGTLCMASFHHIYERKYRNNC